MQQELVKALKNLVVAQKLLEHASGSLQIAVASEHMPIIEVAKRKWFLLRMLPWKKAWSTMQLHQKTGKHIAVNIKMAMYELVSSVKQKE